MVVSAMNKINKPIMDINPNSGIGIESIRIDGSKFGNRSDI